MSDDPVREQEESGRKDYEIVDGEMRSKQNGGEQERRIAKGERYAAAPASDGQCGNQKRAYNVGG